MENPTNSTWTESSKIFDEIASEEGSNCTTRALKSDTNKIYFVNCQDLFVYDPSTDATKLLVKSLASTQNLPIINDGYLWAFSTSGQDPWLSKYSLEDGKIETFNAKRPMDFYKALSVINGSDAFISTSNGLVELDLSSDIREFKSIGVRSVKYTSDTFIPIGSSNYVITFSQDCEMVCAEPEFYKFDYATKEIQKISISNELKTKFSGTDPYSYAYIDYVGTSDDNNPVFSINQTVDKFVYDVNAGNWILDYTGSVNPLSKPGCGIVADYSESSGFSNIKCSDDGSAMPDSSSSIITKYGIIGTIEYGGLYIKQ